jgi:hypothetical protein
MEDKMSEEETVTVTRSQLDEITGALEKMSAYTKQVEHSAATARELARVAMSHTGRRGIQVELTVDDGGIRLIVCDPAGNELETTKRVAELFNAALLARCGIKLTDDEPTPYGSTA